MSGVKHTRGLTFEQRAEAAGHVLRRDEDGEIDVFVLSEGYHNGPGCVVCDDSWCHHCDDNIEPCDGGKAKSERRAVERVRAAAPDLLSVAKLTLKTILDEAEARDFDPPADTNLVAELEAAITRATGDRPEKGENK